MSVLHCRRNLPQLRSYVLLANMRLKWQLWITLFRWRAMSLFHPIQGTWHGLLQVIAVFLVIGRQ